MEYGKGVLGDSFYKSDWLNDRFKITSLFTQSNIFKLAIHLPDERSF